ncbi:hypothetical protein GCM10022600_19700 [Qipengyuania pelagi]|jgi:hypothetical protein|uniref:DUF2842 domain-containing protein n=1 Tax=Qipengyuania pelagi TaxID=994320 RepID=A0A844Y3V4_9SPHN|nr:DUF2842 domain-containing protein [Qipengyuania pelagi]MXO53180.1 DUF2842 domain-containing protein [Qipengyuania pelagi]
MREEPTLRIPLGILGLLVGLTVYGVLVVTLVPPLIESWPTILQTVVYLIFGVIWLLPLKRFLIWMETGRWSAPDE